jgi:hypothetical protein
MFESFLWFAIGCVSYGIVARLLSVAFVEEVQFKLVLLRSLLLLRVAKEKSESLLRESFELTGETDDDNLEQELDSLNLWCELSIQQIVIVCSKMNYDVKFIDWASSMKFLEEEVTKAKTRKML